MVSPPCQVSGNHQKDIKSVSFYIMAKNEVKKRNWAFILYPESAPEDWREQLQKSGIQAAISPLHDKDINPDGEPKKAHYHVILVYGNPTTYNNVKGFCDRLNQPIPQALEQVRGYYRYLTHEDNPEKVQYSKADIEHVNGFDIRDFVELTRSEVGKVKREIMQLIRDNNLTEYADLIDILMDGGEATADMFDVATNNTLFFAKYLTSRWRMSHGSALPDDSQVLGKRDTDQGVTQGVENGTE